MRVKRKGVEAVVSIIPTVTSREKKEETSTSRTGGITEQKTPPRQISGINQIQEEFRDTS